MSLLINGFLYKNGWMQGNKIDECFIRLSALTDLLTKLQKPHCKRGERINAAVLP
jgi:hypothetical protein